MAETLTELLLEAADTYDDRIALRIGSGEEWRSYSYGEVKALSEQLGKALIDLGIGRTDEFGDRIVVLTENRPEFVVADLAIRQVQGIIAPAHKEYTAPEVKYHLQDSGAKALIVSTAAHLEKALSIPAEELPKLERIIVTDLEELHGMVALKASRDPRVLSLKELLLARSDKQSELEKRRGTLSPDDVTTLIYTSGTTSSPKGVMHTNATLLFALERITEILKLPDPYIALNVLPLPHSFGYLADYLMPFTHGGEVIYSTKAEFVENIKRWKPTCISGAPKLFERMQTGIRAKGGGILGGAIDKAIQGVLQNPESRLAGVLEALGGKVTGGRLEYFVSGGAALDPELFKWIRTLGLEILQGYGMTEGVPFSVNAKGEGNRTAIGSAGRILDGLDVIVEPAHDLDGKARKTEKGDTIGELFFAGPLLMKGYWNKPEETARALVTRDGKTYMRTGDLGYIRQFPDGRHVFIVGRSKDEIVLSTGKNVSPGIVEELITRHPDISQAMLHGSENEYMGTQNGKDRPYVTALIGVSPASLQKAAKLSGAHGTQEQLLREESVLAYYRGLVEEQVRDLGVYMRPKDIRLIPEVTENDLWTINGKPYAPLTPTLKLKRPVVQTHFRELINGMYKKDE
ncbi:AMP-binding protein [Candidatus Woesearchaeota archaeon]|nr:AMP-binding protein [Candidatus Woesearchaeota archaeon]